MNLGVIPPSTRTYAPAVVRQASHVRTLRGWLLASLVVIALVWGPAQAREVDIHSPAPFSTTRELPVLGGAGSGFGVRAPAEVWNPSARVLLAEVKEALKSRGGGAAGSLNVLVVIYPDIGEPYRTVFTNIIDGIEEIAKTKVRSIAIAPNTDPTELNSQLRQYGTKVVIALGQQGWKATANLDKDIAVVVGCVLRMPDSGNRTLMGISLTPDPAQLFARLKSLQSSVKKVHVVYSPQANAWLIKLAREAARTHGLELIAHEATDLSSAAKLYANIFAEAVSGRDALWLPNDSTTVDENTILPLVLQESWTRGVPIFSSNFSHVKKGALFALYPNNVELGRDLASMALGALGPEQDKRGFSLLQAVNVAVNLRTASHVGISIASQQQRSFHSVFPEQ
ncbi:MAG: ABC transporter substrate binding protein [Pseudomonadota bacterium]